MPWCTYSAFRNTQSLLVFSSVDITIDLVLRHVSHEMKTFALDLITLPKKKLTFKFIFLWILIYSKVVVFGH